MDITFIITLVYIKPSGKRDVTAWRPSVRLSVCPVFLILIERASQRDLPGGSMRRGQRTFRPNSEEDTDILQ